MTGPVADADGGPDRRGPDPRAAELVTLHRPALGRVLVVGAGAGELATDLAALRYAVTCVEADPVLAGSGRHRDPRVVWVVQEADRLVIPGPTFDLAILDESVVTERARGTLAPMLVRVCRHLRPGGLVLAGFPLTATRFGDAWQVADYDRACAVAGLSYVARLADWLGNPYHAALPYVVCVHRVR